MRKHKRKELCAFALVLLLHICIATAGTTLSKITGNVLR